jgi:hypothetical protein
MKLRVKCLPLLILFFKAGTQTPDLSVDSTFETLELQQVQTHFAEYLSVKMTLTYIYAG